MPLLDIPKSSSKVKATVELEQSTAELIDHYAAYSKATADDVIEQALRYVFRKDKDFQKHVEQNKDKAVPPSLKLVAKPGRKSNGKSQPNDSAAIAAIKARRFAPEES